MRPEQTTAVIQALIEIIENDLKKGKSVFLISTRITKEIIDPLIDETIEAWTKFGYGTQQGKKTKYN